MFACAVPLFMRGKSTLFLHCGTLQCYLQPSAFTSSFSYSLYITRLLFSLLSQPRLHILLVSTTSTATFDLVSFACYGFYRPQQMPEANEAGSKVYSGKYVLKASTLLVIQIHWETAQPCVTVTSQQCQGVVFSELVLIRSVPTLFC